MTIDTDTFHSTTISVPLEKKLLLAECLESFFGLCESSITELASLCGRVQHYWPHELESSTRLLNGGFSKHA
jgi:hypothetical protein